MRKVVIVLVFVLTIVGMAALPASAHHVAHCEARATTAPLTADATCSVPPEDPALFAHVTCC